MKGIILFYLFMVFLELIAEWKESRICNYLLNGTTCTMERKKRLQLSVE